MMSKGLPSMGSNDNRVTKRTVGGDFLATLNWRMYPSPPSGNWLKFLLFDQIPTLCLHSPPPQGVYIDGCIIFFHCQDSDFKLINRWDFYFSWRDGEKQQFK